ncbi:hypothetical protein [Psychromarinibacter sp. S121]|uniref:hypothetical protein n=1 Tax=Psychromarinibacter sp. S121 TaxID=3415127 RepID=UPI003C7D5343
MTALHTARHLLTSLRRRRFALVAIALVVTAFVLQGPKLAVIFAACALLLIDPNRPTIHTAEQMDRELGLRPVVSIPHFASPAEKLRTDRLHRFVRVASITALLVFFADWLLPFL